MSRIEAVTVPKWGMTMTEGTITQWLVGEGENVVRGQEVLEIETTKVTNVVEATASGTLRRVVLKEGTTAPVGALAGVITDDAATADEIEAFIATYADRMDTGEGGEAGATALRAVPVGGGTVNLLAAGEHSDDVVLFLHGFGGDLSTWLFNQPEIAQSMRTISVDLPGHGNSTPVRGGDVLSAISSAVMAAIEDIAAAKVHLVAHSFGGAVAASIAAKEPSRIASVTLIAPIGLGKEISRDFLVDFIAAERRRPLLSVLERLFSDPSKITNDMVEGTLRFKRLEGVPEALTEIAAVIADDNGQVQEIGETLASLTCPVLLIWGGEDKIVPLPKREDVSANIDMRVIPGVGHMPQMEASSAVNEAIAENIRRG